MFRDTYLQKTRFTNKYRINVQRHLPTKSRFYKQISNKCLDTYQQKVGFVEEQGEGGESPCWEKKHYPVGERESYGKLVLQDKIIFNYYLIINTVCGNITSFFQKAIKQVL